MSNDKLAPEYQAAAIRLVPAPFCGLTRIYGECHGCHVTQAATDAGDRQRITSSRRTGRGRDGELRSCPRCRRREYWNRAGWQPAHGQSNAPPKPSRWVDRQDRGACSNARSDRLKRWTYRHGVIRGRGRYLKGLEQIEKICRYFAGLILVFMHRHADDVAGVEVGIAF
jgi:hypothetical protein